MFKIKESKICSMYLYVAKIYYLLLKQMKYVCFVDSLQNNMLFYHDI